MLGCLLICRSVTYAQRTKKVLEHVGINGRIVRPNLRQTGGECGYAVRISEVFLAEALEALGQNRISPEKVLLADVDGGLREMAL